MSDSREGSRSDPSSDPRSDLRSTADDNAMGATMQVPDVVALNGMRFFTRVGVLPHEAELAQPVEVDVAVTVAAGLRAPDVVDYVALYTAVAGVMSAAHISYLEDAAERIAAAALRLGGVRTVTIAVRKPHVPLPGPVAYAEVVIHRSRDDG